MGCPAQTRGWSGRTQLGIAVELEPHRSEVASVHLDRWTPYFSDSSHVSRSTTRASTASVTSRAPSRSSSLEPARTVTEHCGASVPETTSVVSSTSFASPPPGRRTGLVGGFVVVVTVTGGIDDVRVGVCVVVDVALVDA